MALRILLIILGIQLGLLLALSPLPQLPNNRLDEGNGRELPDPLRKIVRIHCDRRRQDTGRLTSRSLHEALAYFETRPFTSSILANPPYAISVNETRVKFVEIKGRRFLYALQQDPTGEKAYWLHQGVYMQEPYPYLDIPRYPTADQPKYVFTPDFSGCSLTVTPLNNGDLRIRHVGGMHEARQFNDLSQDQKGGSITYAMQYREYAYTMETRFLVENTEAFAYMHYTGGQWTLRIQRKICSPYVGTTTLSDDNLLASATLREANGNNYFNNPISSTKTFIIPYLM